MEIRLKRFLSLAMAIVMVIGMMPTNVVLAAEGDESTPPETTCSHNYEADVTAPDCVNDGYTTYTCSGCGDSYTETVAASGHSYAGEVTTPATCTEDGVKTYTCSGCGDSYTEAIPAGHTPGAEATCTTAQTCSACGTELVAATGHVNTTTINTATCGAAGVKTVTCACGETVSTEDVAATGEHSYAGEVTTPATCTDDGVKTYTCSGCGDSYTEVIPAGHTPGAEATCTTAQTCSACGTELVAATGHVNTTTTNTATCGAAGVKTVVCACGETVSTEDVAATGEHDYKEGVCSVCNAEDPDWALGEGDADGDNEPEEDPLVVQVQGMINALPELPPVVKKAELEAYMAKVDEITAIMVNMTKEQTDQLTGLEKLYPNVTLEEPVAVAKIGDTGYATFAEALTAAAGMSGEVTVEIYDKVTLNTGLSGSYSSIKFVGKDTDAEIYLEVQGYITATGKKVAFENLKLSKSEGGFITNAGFMNVAFGVYDVTEVNYTDCTFTNGAYASSGKVTFTRCTFYRSWDKYGLWAYGDVNCVVEECTFDDYRGIKMYAEDQAKTTDLTVKNSDFSALGGEGSKPAIVLTYGESVTLEGNTYSSTGTFELDKDGAPNGTAVTSDVAPTCTNDDGACGVLVDGKIYTTVADAAAVATSGSTVTLLHNSTETVVLPEGVTLEKNGFEAAGVTVPVTIPGAVATKAELTAAIANANDGDVITLTADIDYGTDHLKIEKAITLNLGGYTLTTRARNYGLALYNGCAVTNGKLNHAGTVAAIKVWDANEISDLEIDVTGTSASGNTIDGIVIQENAVGVDTIKNVTVHSTSGQGVDSGIKTFNCGNAEADVIGSMENVTVDAKSIGLNISAPCGTATNCSIKGGTAGIEIWIKDNYSASLNLVNCDVDGGVNAHDEYSSNPDIVNNGTLSLTADAATTGASVNDVTLTIARAEKVEGVLEEVKDAAVAKIGNTYYTSLAAAVKAAESGATITLLNGEYELPAFSNKELTFRGESKDGVIINDAPNANAQDWVGSTIHFENLTAKGATANYHGLANGVVALTYKNCNVNGLRFLYATDVSFEDCAFNADGVEHSFWTYGASNITVKNCTFTYTDRAVNCYSENGANHETDIAFSGCTFTYAGTADAPEGAVEINSGSSKSIDLTMDDCTDPAKGAMWFNSQWDSKDGANTTVYVDSELVWPDAVAKIGNKEYGSLQKAIAEAQSGETVELLTNVTEEVEITDGKTVVIDLKGMTLNGAIKPSKADLTVQNGSIVNTNASYSAIEITEGKLTLTDVKITSARHGVRIDGAVEATINGGEYLVNYTEGTRHAVNVSGAANVTIKDGIFVGPAGTTMDSGAAVNVQTGATVTIEDGKFSGGKNHTLDGAGTITVMGGNFDQDPTKYVATGYEAVKQETGTWNVQKIKIAEVNGVPYESLEAAVEAAAAAQTGVEIIMLNDVTLDATVTLPAGVIFNGNGKVITGTIAAGGDLTIAGQTTVGSFNPGWYNNTITIGEGASLKVTTGRLTVSYGNTFNIIGSIDDAKNADKSNIIPSLELDAGISFNGDGGGVKFNVTNAYVKLGDSTTKNSGATGEFNLNFTNSIVDFTNTLKTNIPTKSGLAPVFNLTAKDSVIDVASHLEFWLDKTNVILDNSNLTVGGSFANAGAVTVENGAKFVVNAPIMSSHGGNTGSINVTGGTFELKDSNQDWENAGTMTVSGTGTLITNDFKCVGDGKIVVDAAEIVRSRTVVDGNGAYDFTTVTTLENGDHVKAISFENGDVSITVKPVAKIGNTEYETIDEAIANWTHKTTLTLLADVTLTDVIKLSSTETHILDLGTFTMTAAKGKDAIQIVNNGRSSASYTLDIMADATNPGGITAAGKAIVRTAGKTGVKDRPIIRFYNGVFNASNIVYHNGSNGTNCPQFYFYDGVYNGTIYTNRTLNQFYGGVFNGSLMMSVDSSAYTLIASGTFKQLSNLYMSALNSNKFTIGSAKGVYDREVYVNDDGYYVVAAAKPAEDFEAAIAMNPGSNDYFYYSKVKSEGAMNYTDVYVALKNNTTADVAVYVDEIDMTDSTFKGKLLIEDELTVTFAEGTTPAWTVAPITDGEVVGYTDSVENGVVTRVYKAFIAVAKIGETHYETFKDALYAVEDGQTITMVEGATGSELDPKNGLDFTKAISFTITGNAPDYALPVITFQNATVTIKDAEILIPELDARQNATINVVDSIVHDAGGNSIAKSYYNGAINISGNSVVHMMQVTTMGYITIADTAKLNATWQTNVYGNGMITVADDATFATAGLSLTGKDYSGRDNTDTDRVGKPATIVVDGANLIVGKVTSDNGADYSYNSSKGINVGTVAGKSAVLDIKNGANVNIYMANGETANIGADGTVNVDGSTLNVACRGEGNVKLSNNGTVYVTGESNVAGNVTGEGWFYMNDVTLDADTKLNGAKVRFTSGVNEVNGSVIDNGWFQVGIGVYNGVDTRENPETVVVDVNNAVIGCADKDYAGWIGTGYFDTDAQKAAAMTTAKYILNINNSTANFGYLHISNDGELNVNGEPAELSKYNGSTYGFHAGRFIINGVANFEDAAVWVSTTTVSCDNGTSNPGTLNIKNGTAFEIEVHNGSYDKTNFKLSKTGVVNVMDGATVTVGEATTIAVNAQMNIMNGAEVTALGKVTNNGTLNLNNAKVNANINVNALVNMDSFSRINGKITGEGKIVVDTSNMYETTDVQVVNGDCTTANIEATTASVRKDGTGAWVYFEAMVQGENGWTGYATLADAVEAAKDGEMVLLTRDVTLDKAILVEGKSISIGNVDGEHKITNTADDVFTVANGGELTLNWLTINSNTSILWAKDGGTINVNGGILNGAKYVTTFADGGEININNSEITSSTDTAISAKNSGIVNINDSKVTASSCSAISAKTSGVINVNGGHIETTCSDPEFCAAYAGSNGVINILDGTVKAAAGYSVVAVSDGIVNISGGNIENGVKAHENANAKVNISGGHIYGSLATANNAAIEISAGWFDKDPRNITGVKLADNMTWTEDNKWIHHATYVAFIDADKDGELDADETGYTSLADAIAAAKNGDTVKMLNVIDEAVVIEKSITIDLNGYMLTNNGAETEGAVVTIKSGDVTITDSTTDHRGSIHQSGNGHAIKVSESASLTLNAAVDGCYAGIVAYGDVTIQENGHVSAHSTAATCGDGIRVYGDAVVTLNGGSITSCGSAQGYGIELYENAKAVINNGHVAGKSAICVYGGTLEVNAGHIQGGTEYAIVTTPIGAESSNGNADVTINDGYIEGPVVVEEGTNLPAGYTASVKINNGNFEKSKDQTGDMLVVEDKQNNAYSMTVSGGWYAAKIDESFLAPGFALEVNEDGSCYVVHCRMIDFSEHWTDEVDAENLYVDGIRVGEFVIVNGDIEVPGEMADKKYLFITEYGYDSGDAGVYPETMKVWLATGNDENGDGLYDTYNVAYCEALKDFFMYEGTSIRVGDAKNGIRFFTSIAPEAQNGLISGNFEGLPGAKLSSAGTEFWINNVQRSYVYGGSAGKNFRVFGQTDGGRNLFTGMLVDLDTDPATIATHIHTRPFAELEIGNDRVTLYGGELERSIYEVAVQVQNAQIFEEGSTYFDYVQNLIDKVDNSNG